MSETRKLQRIGGNTLYVSLPKDWANQTNMKQGDKVTLILQPDGSIRIFPTIKEEKPREIALKITHKDSSQSLRRAIMAAYVDGFEIIKVESKDRLTEEQHDIIRKTIDRLFALELIEVTANKMAIQCLLKETIPIEKTMQRIHNIILSMFHDAISALKERNTNMVKSLTQRKDDVKRLSLVANRILRSMILYPPTESKEMSLIDCVDYLRIIHVITEIADNVNKISEGVSILNDQGLPEYILRPLCDSSVPIHDLYDQSIQALLSKDVLLANKILDTKTLIEKLWGLCIEADEKSEVSCLALSQVYLLLDNLIQIQQYSNEIAEIAIDRAEAEMKRLY